MTHHWAEQFDGRYNAYVTHGGFGASHWPLHVTDTTTGQVIGSCELPIMCHHYSPDRFRIYRDRAERIVSDHLRWAPIPEGGA